MLGNKYTRWLCVTLTLAWMCLIFCLSAQSASDSSKTSGVLVETFAKLLGIIRGTERYSILTTVIRKLAHLSEFAVLGALCRLSLLHFGLSKRVGFLLAIGISALYAVTDEIHQLFVVGRACRFTDVCIDSLGALLGIAFVTLIIYLLRRKK